MKTKLISIRNEKKRPSMLIACTLKEQERTIMNLVLCPGLIN